MVAMPGESVRAGDEPLVEVGYKGATLSLRGAASVFVLAVLVIAGSTLYGGLRVEWAMAREFNALHTKTADLAVAQSQTSCLLTMMSDEQRIKFRDTYVPGAFKRWCPWIKD